MYMDELEISGRRFISTRRAGKDYKYHSDYIGQLARSKKVVGQKVGRSWYVDAESLATYLADPQTQKENIAPAKISKVDVPEEAATAPAREEVMESAHAPDAVQQAELAEVEPTAEEDAQEEKINVQKKDEIIGNTIQENFVEEFSEKKEAQTETARAIYVPIRRPSFAVPAKETRNLRYIEEDAPATPEIRKAHMPIRTAGASVKPDEEKAVERENVQEEIRSTPKFFVPLISIAAAGVLVFVLVAASSVFVSSNLIKEAGKPASVGYTLH